MLANFDGLYDMEEQARLREDCSALVGKHLHVYSPCFHTMSPLSLLAVLYREREI